MWTLLAVLAVVCLVVFWRGPNAVWGGLLLGAVGGLVVAVIALLVGKPFVWATVGKGIIVGILAGAVAELVGRIATRLSRRVG